MEAVEKDSYENQIERLEDGIEQTLTVIEALEQIQHPDIKPLTRLIRTYLFDAVRVY